jgi:hypothetical protein
MALISKIGPFEASIIFLLAALFLYRIQAPSESRVASAMVFLFLAKFGASFIGGFPISNLTESLLGQLNAIFAYLMLAFVLLEVLLLKLATAWERADLQFLACIFGVGVLNLVWKLTFNLNLSAHDLIYALTILLVTFLRPTRIDLRFLPYLGAFLILLVAVTALFKYQNPQFPYRGVDYGLGSPYQNSVWSFFGLTERFRGPFYHPNQLGIQITFLSLLVLLRPTRFYLAILPISFTLLMLASSRTSLLALAVGVLLRLYFDSTKRTVGNSKKENRHRPINDPQKISTFKKLLLGITVVIVIAILTRQVVGNNTTGTGRTEIFRRTLTKIQENILIGSGPSIYSVNITENTILTLLSYYGLLGFALVIGAALALTIKYRRLEKSARAPLQVILASFAIATSAESLWKGTSDDTGLYYLLVFIVLTRKEIPMKVSDKSRPF